MKFFHLTHTIIAVKRVIVKTYFILISVLIENRSKTHDSSGKSPTADSSQAETGLKPKPKSSSIEYSIGLDDTVSG